MTLTSVKTTTNALFDLAAHQKYVEPLREEVEAAVSALGWTKEAMARMVKLDSFLKESSRLQGVGVGTFSVKIPFERRLSFVSVSLTRKVLKDLPLSNGVVVPAGCTLGVASYPIHRNPVSHFRCGGFDLTDKISGSLRKS